MLDLRLTWLKYLAGPDGLLIVYPSNINSPAVATIGRYSKDKGIDKWRVVKADYSGNGLIPLSKEELSQAGRINIVYLFTSRRSAKYLQTKLLAAGQEMVGEYAILSGWKNPRWCVPKGRRFSIGDMASIINPSSVSGIIGFMLFKFLRKVNLDHLVFADRIIMVKKKYCSTSRLEEIFCKEDINKMKDVIGESIRPGIIYTGSFGPLQKFTVQLLGKDGIPIAYVKIGHDDLTRKAVRWENNILSDLSKINLHTIRIPESILIDRFFYGQDQALVQKSLQGGKPLRRLTPSVVQSLVELYETTRLPDMISLNSYIDHFVARSVQGTVSTMDDAHQAIWNNMIGLLDKLKQNFGDYKISTCLSHGDFTRWNVRKYGRTLNVIDWEEARMRSPGYDILTFLFVEELLVRHANKTKIAEQFIQIALGKGDHNCQDYFRKITPKLFKSPLVYVILFITEMTNYYLWHAKEHKRRNFPTKESIHYVLKTTAEVLRALKTVAKREYLPH